MQFLKVVLSKEGAGINGELCGMFHLAGGNLKTLLIFMECQSLEEIVL